MAQDDIQGQVVDGSGNPVSGAIVELTKSYQSSPTEREKVFRTTTDSNGNYIFTGHPDGDGTTQEWHVAAYSHDGTAYVNSFNNPGVTADLPSNTIPDSVIDNFENADADPAGVYESGETVGNYYQGRTSSWERTTSNVVEGVSALRPTSGGGPEPIWSLPGDGLPNYLHEGDTVEFLIRDQGIAPVVCLNVEDASAPSAYGFNLTSRVEIYKITDLSDLFNSESKLGVGSGGVSSNVWYIGEVSTPTSSDATITYSLYENDNLSKGTEVDSLTVEDNDFAGQPGIGFYRRSSGNFTAVADRIRVI